MSTSAHQDAEGCEILVHWLPLGAGGRSVRWNGRVFEAIVARHEHRSAMDLYHSALEVRLGRGVRFTIEMAPEWGGPGGDRGAVVRGPVGLRWLGRSRIFRYEVRCWRNGVIPDLDRASACRVVGHDLPRALRLVALVPHVPTLTWGLDELGAGEMWNSNSVVSWLLVRSGHDVYDVGPPARGRAPGWTAGAVIASRTGDRPGQGDGA